MCVACSCFLFGCVACACSVFRSLFGFVVLRCRVFAFCVTVSVLCIFVMFVDVCIHIVACFLCLFIRDLFVSCLLVFWLCGIHLIHQCLSLIFSF